MSIRLGEVWTIVAEPPTTVPPCGLASAPPAVVPFVDVGTAGGMHYLWSCHTPGVGLTEGFADFIAYAVQFDFDAIDPVANYLNYHIESPSSSICLRRRISRFGQTAAHFSASSHAGV